jgi:hypothetical protein
VKKSAGESGERGEREVSDRQDYILADGGGPNPSRAGACGGCGSYRADGRPPYLHHPGCPHDDLQIDRYLRELAAGDLAGPALWE